MRDVYLQSGDDVRRLHHLVSQYQSWTVSARRIELSSRLSPSDWATLTSILKTSGTIGLQIKTEVDWKELVTALSELPEISELRLSDNQWNEITDLLTNINNKQLYLRLSSEVKCNTETVEQIDRLAGLCKHVTVDTLRLSEGMCVNVRITTKEISIYGVYLQSGDDVRRLHHLVSQYQSWTVRYEIYLTELGSDDWTLLAQLLFPRLTTSVGWVVITSNSTSHPAPDTLRLLWDKTNKSWGWWRVNSEGYRKGDDGNFDKMFNKHFK